MPTSADPVALVDTSAAIPFLLRRHSRHDLVFGVLREFSLGLAGHAAFETYSTLTRLPSPARVAPRRATEVIAHEFPRSVHLGPGRAAALFDSLPDLGIAGGAIYDALVGAAAVEHELRLFTRDRRAERTYLRLGVDYELLD